MKPSWPGRVGASRLLVGIARETIGNLLKGIGTPRWATVEAFVRFCDPGGTAHRVDTAAWRARYEEAYGSAPENPAEPGDAVGDGLPRLLIRLAASLSEYGTTEDPLVSALVQNRAIQLTAEVGRWALGEYRLERPECQRTGRTTCDFAIIDGKMVVETLYDSAGGDVGDRRLLNDQRRVNRYLAFLEDLRGLAIAPDSFAA